MRNTIIYLIGGPGVGKQTIAKEIQKKQSFTLVDNHSYTNAIFSISKNYDHPKHEEYRLKVRNIVLEAMGEICPKGESFIFTNVISKGEEDSYYKPVEKLATTREALFIPVTLSCDLNENKKRIANPFRKEYLKTLNPEAVQQIANLGLPEIKHPNLLQLDVTKLSAADAAVQIIEHANHICKMQNVYNAKYSNNANGGASL